MLAAAGIDRAEELEALGAVEAYRRCLDAGTSPHLSLLWALEGALLDLPWTDLTTEMKRSLLDELGDSP